jgi:hypothetical protein
MSDERKDCIHMPREESATLASDFHNAIATLRMCLDRVLDGTPLHVKRYTKGDPVALMREGTKHIIDEIFATAVIDE